MIDMDSYNNLKDEELQKLAVSGDRDAEERLTLRYTRLVRICSRPYFLAGGDSEDLIQEGMMGLLSAIREYDALFNSSFKTYAEVCITRRILSAIKSASRLKHTPLNDGVSLDAVLSDDTQTHAALSEPAYRRVPEEQVLARESEEEFLSTYSRCLSKLENEMLSLYLQGLSYQEMAERTGRPLKSVDNAVQRIRKKLAVRFNSGDDS